MIARSTTRCRTSGPKTPVVLLYGIDGTFNFGCEGIIRGTLEILQETSERAVRVVFLSRRYWGDRRSLADLEMDIRPLHSKLRPTYLAGALARRAGLRWKAASRLPVDLIRSADAAVCIGGDVYDPDSQYLREFTDTAQSFGVPVVYWGASFPAYECTTSYTEAYREHLRSLSLITVREPASMEFLDAQGVRENIQLCADPAFCMTAEPFPLPFSRQQSDLVIGINLSPYSTALTFGYDQLAAKATDFGHAIEQLLDAVPCHILLIPHVLSPFNWNNDAVFLRRVAERVKRHRERLHIGPTGIGAQRTKGLLSACDLVIAARMHCCIAALSSGLPTILLSYSQKARGIARYAYGTDACAIALRDFNGDTLHRAVNLVVRDISTIRAQLEAAKPGWVADAMGAGLALRSILTRGEQREPAVGFPG